MSLSHNPIRAPVPSAFGDAALELIEAAPVAMLASDHRGVIVMANAAARRMLGYTAEELRGLEVAALLAEKYLQPLRAFLANFWLHPEDRPMESGREFPIQLKGGGEIWVRLGLSPVRVADTVYALGALLDITARRRAEQDREESERTMAAILDHSFEFIGLLDPAGHLLRANRTSLAEAGVSWEEVRGRLFWETPWWTHSPAEQEKLRAAVARAARGEFVRFATTHPGAGGRLLHVDFSLKPVRDEAGRVTALIPEGRDITEMRATEQALRDSEEKFSKAFRASPDAISVHEMESGSIVDVNEGYLRLFGYEHADLIGRRPTELSIWVDSAERENFLALLRARGSARDFQARVRLRSGEIRVAQLSSEIVEIDGRPHNVTVLRDVTDRLGAEQALRESEEKFSKAFRASPDAMSVSDRATGRILDINEGYERLSGYRRDELIGRTSAELGIWQDPGDRRRMLAELERTGAVRDMKVTAQNRAGEAREFLLAAEQVEIGGRPCLVIVSRDITAQGAAEQALRESEEKFSKAFRASPDAIAITDLATGRYLEANGGHREIFGYTREEVIGRTTLELGYYRDPADRLRLVEAIRAGGSVRNMELACYNRHREPITVLLSGEFIEMNGQPCIVSVIHDITQRKRAEEALRESEEKFSKAFRASPYSITISELATGRYLDVNGGFEQISGYSRTEVLGRTAAELGLWQREEDRADLVERLRKSGFVRDVEYEFRRRDGSPVLTLNNCELIEIGGVPCLLNTIEDVTERRRTERENIRLEQQLRQSQKLEALGTLAGGIAHDFNNILTAMVVFRELAVMDLDRPDDLRKHLAEIKQAINRAKELVRQILTFSRQQPQERRAVRLHPVINEALRLLRSSLPSTLEMDLAIDEQAPEVLADTGQVHQIVMNLATNAAHAMRDRPGRLAVRLAPRQVDAELCRSHPGLRPGPYAQLTVADNGHGMSEATLAHIFEPFFTTKAPGEGTGLGLAVVHGIMEDHDGAITVRSRPGEGTTFDLYFPQYLGAVEARAEPDASIPPGRGESVLLVDDEPPLCEAIGGMLRRLGYRVTACPNPVEAVARFAAAPATFDLVLTDHTMPRLTGLDLIREVHAVRPGIPVMLISGLSNTWTAEKLRGFNIREIVAKPVDLAGLAQAVRRAIDRPAPAGQ